MRSLATKLIQKKHAEHCVYKMRTRNLSAIEKTRVSRIKQWKGEKENRLSSTFWQQRDHNINNSCLSSGLKGILQRMIKQVWTKLVKHINRRPCDRRGNSLFIFR